MVLACGIITEHQHRVYCDYGSGKNRKATWLNATSIKDYEGDMLIGFHSLSGNDYISALFRKGKTSCWKLVIKNEQFLQAFSKLGNTWDLGTDVIDKLEVYVCCLYGSKKKSVNAVRFDRFIKKKTRSFCYTTFFMLRTNLHLPYHRSWMECRR